MTGATPPIRRSAPQAWLILAALGSVALVAIVGLLIRYGPLTPAGRLLVEAQANGLEIGRLGKLRVLGVRGDLWRDFTLDRLQIADEKGVWLEARGLRVRWRYAELFRRRLHVDLVTGREVTVIRRPSLRPKRKSGSLPLSFEIDRAAFRLVTLPGFSVRRGVYDLAASLRVERGGGGLAAITGSSILHPGDFLRLKGALRRRAFVLDADAVEARGGAIAGSLGLSADQAFGLTVRAAGSSASGRVFALARVGSDVPVRISGGWSPSGGRGQGTLELAASRYLARYQKFVGPTVAFTLAARQVREGSPDLALDLRGANATLAARGQVDLARRSIGPKGMAVDLILADAGRLASSPAMGAARVRGGLGGDAGHWKFAGAASVDRLAGSGFTLARVSGPLSLEDRGRTLDIQAGARGEGGAGKGLLAAMLGARPRASAQLTVLPDGRLLMRRLSLAGPGIEVAASGARGLFGGLSFKGSAKISNLAAAYPGAKGLVTANWTASQDGAKPWAVSFDATGARLASGLGEVDRLLGPRPRLRVTAEVRLGGIAVSQGRLDGAAGSLGASGTVGSAGALALALDWRAQGPFRAGPLEIAGAARGSGALTGSIASPRADLVANFDRIDLPYLPLAKANVRLTFAAASGGGDGHLAVAGASAYGPARGAAAFRFAPGGLDLSVIDLAAAGVAARGSLSLRRNLPSSADLVLAAGPGELLSQGRAQGRIRIVDAPGGASANLELTAADARLRQSGLAVQSLKLRADGPLARLPYVLSAQGSSQTGPWRVSGSGAYGQSGGERTLSFAGAGRIRRADFRTLTPALFRLGRARSSADLHLAVGGGRGDVSVSSVGQSLSVKATLADVSLGLVNEDLVGRFDATLGADGRGSTLAGKAIARLTGAGGRDLKGEPPVDGAITASLAGGSIGIDADFANAKGLKASAQIVVPARASAAPFAIAINRTGPLRGRFSIAGQLKPVWDLVMGGDRSLSGQVTAAGTLSGALADPKAEGTASLAAGAFDDAQTGLKLRNVALTAVLTGDTVDVSGLSAVDGAGGSLSGQGRISLERDGASSFRLRVDRFRLIDNDLGQASASGTATVSRAADGKVKLSGALNIDRAQIAPKPPIASGVVAMDVVEIHRPPTRADQDLALARPPSPIALDVTFKAPRGVFVRGRGLDVELALDARIVGTTADPILTGAARVVRGDYDFAGKRFRFDDRGVVRLGSRPELIRLDLTAIREDPSLTAVIRIQGTAAKPEVTLTSTPVLPPDEVLSQVLFGASASQLSGLEAAQLASALSGLAGGGGFDVMGGLRTFAHLDRLAVAGSAATGSSLVGGKYLTDSLYLELGGGGREGATAQVEWRVKKHLSIVSRLTGQGESQLSIRWRKDY